VRQYQRDIDPIDLRAGGPCDLAELQDLVVRELVDQIGVKFGSKYSLSEYARLSHERRRPRPNRRAQTREALVLRTNLSKNQLAELTGASDKTVEHWLRQMKKDGEIEIAQGGRACKNTEYRLSGRGLQGTLPTVEGEPPGDETL
jgi:transposase